MPRRRACRAPLDRLPPQALFVLGAISQYVGAALAVLLFAKVPGGGRRVAARRRGGGRARRVAAAVADALDGARGCGSSRRSGSRSR